MASQPLAGADTRWYALLVRQRYEKIAAAVLRNKGYEEFLPLYRARHCWSDRIAELDLPLFPGYVFCRFDPNHRSVPILTTPGVIQAVGAGRLPLDDAEIEAIQLIIRSGLPAEPWPYLKSGSPVRIGAGPLAGVEGIFLEAKKRHRLVVSVTLLQRSVAVDIDSAYVVPVRHDWRGPLPYILYPAH